MLAVCTNPNNASHVQASLKLQRLSIVTPVTEGSSSEDLIPSADSGSSAHGNSGGSLRTSVQLAIPE